MAEIACEIVCTVEVNAETLAQRLVSLSRDMNQTPDPAENDYFVLHQGKIVAVDTGHWRVVIDATRVQVKGDGRVAIEWVGTGIVLSIEDYTGKSRVKSFCSEHFTVDLVRFLEQINKIQPVNILAPTADELRTNGETWAGRLLALMDIPTDAHETGQEEEPRPDNQIETTATHYGISKDRTQTQAAQLMGTSDKTYRKYRDKGWLLSAEEFQKLTGMSIAAYWDKRVSGKKRNT